MEVNTNLITTICNRLRSIDGTFSSYSDLFDMCVRNSSFPHIWNGLMEDNYHIHPREVLLTILNASNRLDIHSASLHSLLLSNYWTEVGDGMPLQMSNKSLDLVDKDGESWTLSHNYLRTHLPSYIECLYYWTHSDESTRALEARYIHNKVSPQALNKMAIETLRARLETMCS